MKVTVAIPSWNGREHLETCLSALTPARAPGLDVHVVVFDNASTDGTAEWLARTHPHVARMASARNVGFAAACNAMIEASDTPFVALLNNDTRPEPGWIEALTSAIAGGPDDVAAVSGPLVDWTATRLDFGAGLLTFDGHAFQVDAGRLLADARRPADGEDVLFACGGNMIVRRDAFLAVGGFDADYFAYLEDVDLGWRLWAAGHRVRHARDAVARHRSAGSSGRLGLASRGALIERNAWMTACRNYDEAWWPIAEPAVLLTMLSRMRALARNDPAPSFGPERRPDHALRSWMRRPWRVGADGGNPQRLALAEAVDWILARQDLLLAKRREVQARRRRPDREIFGRFPLGVVPTYPGDEGLFADAAFRASLGRLPVTHHTLGDILGPPG